MDEFRTPEELKEFILNYRSEVDDELIGQVGPCYGLSWRKDAWIIRQNNKKLGTIEQKDVPKSFDLRSPEFLMDALAILRKSGIDGLNKYLKALKKSVKEKR